ncbi:hypothetical protein J1614_004942 [Plenodomus biglobosus]|nr:hypothetical protein J1614_004942 [Plenodomus biglobosus]
MDTLDFILENVGIWKDRLVNNSIKSFEDMTVQRWVRIIAIVGGYMLIRPYLLKGAANRQKAAMAKEAEELGLETSAEANANDFRGGRKAAKQRKTVDGVGKD